MKPIAIAFTVGLIAAVTVFGMAIAFLKTLNRRKPMVNPNFTQDHERTVERLKFLGDQVAELRQALKKASEYADAIQELDPLSESSLAQAKKLASAIADLSHEARS